MDAVVGEAAELAVDLAGRAGDVARAAFGSRIPTTAKTSPLDVVTHVDHAAEELILAGIRARFPDHGVHAEESGAAVGSAPWTWLVDPLDGTNNYAIGIPLYGLSIVLLHREQPCMALVQDSHLGNRLVVTDSGARPSVGLRLGPPRLGAGSAVALQQGYAVPRDDAGLTAVRQQMECRFHRVLYTWSPSIDVLLLAAGAVGGIVAYRCAGPEHVAARFLARRVGCEVRIVAGDDGVRSASTYVVGWPGVADRLVEIAEGAAAAQ